MFFQKEIVLQKESANKTGQHGGASDRKVVSTKCSCFPYMQLTSIDSKSAKNKSKRGWNDWFSSKEQTIFYKSSGFPV